MVATDGGGETADCDVMVKVLDVNEAPFIHTYMWVDK